MLGEGAFGRVYRGLDRRLGRAVAVKVIKPWWAEDIAWVERFQREAQLLARVSDPGVVQIFDIGHADEGPYYVAELVEGESLADRLRRGPLPVEEARAVAEQLCRALASAHREGIIHCDVKPANVLLSTGGKVKVGDFGVARLAEGTSQALSATVAGTPRYMSPEQARGRPTTSATDIYSAGIVLYEMLAGEPPFVHGSPVELGLRHLQDPPPPLPREVPLVLREVVERALAKDPADRYRDGGAMADALCAPRSTASPKVTAPTTRDPHRRYGRAADHRPRGSADAGPGRYPDPRAAGRARVTLYVAPSGGPCRRARAPPPDRRAGGPGAAGGWGAHGVPAHRGRRPHGGPRTAGLPRGGVEARARRLHVQPAFSTRYSDAAAGIAIAQEPAAGTHVAHGSNVRVVLSKGPPPVVVPSVVGKPSAFAERLLASAGLHYGVTFVAAPGFKPNVVMEQSPGSAATVSRGAAVALSVSEAPRWRALATFSGVDDGQSVPFRILGNQWRVTYSMAYQGTCLLLVVCLGPSADVHDLRTGSAFGDFELEEGESQTHTFSSGAGLYRLVVSGGQDSARWSMTVEDYY